MPKPSILKVAVPVPLPELFDYLPPQATDGTTLRPGCRLRVPFGRKRLVGVLVSVETRSDITGSRLRAAEELLDQDPVVDPPMLELLLWAARYYQHPVGEVIEAALPRLLRSGRPSRATERRWFATTAGLREDMAALARRAPRQASLLSMLRAATHGADRETLAAGGGDWRGSLRALSRKGLCESRNLSRNAAPRSADSKGEEGPSLTQAQRAAVADIRSSLGGFGAFLLDGVTGSGKTEVYLRVIEDVLARGEQALLLVPEIGLTPQLLSRFSRRFPVHMAILHSGLSDAERLAAWRHAASGDARVIIGTRSGIFAPLPEPGLIIVDEEHDTSLKQQDGFRYSARDLAVVRAQRLGVPVVLGSATPALESMYNAERGRYRRLMLPERPGSVAHPAIRLIDLRAHAAQQGLSTPLLSAMSRHLEADGQVLLFLNRRGYAPALFCSQCGWIAQCDRCDARMTVHMGSKRLRCHHCGRERAVYESCGQCGDSLAPVGQGTERTEETLARLFPGMTVSRMDRDTMQRRGALDRLLTEVRSGHTRILVGTQMLTKGHHFPGVTLVAVLNADQGLFGSDFRSNERFAQTLVQVAGRAGRAERAGEVLIQTSYPEHPLLRRLVNDGYGGFAQAALLERREARWPPYTHLALLRAEAARREEPRQFLEQAAAELRRLAPQRDHGALRVLGPAPAPMEKRAGRFRAQLLLQSARRRHLHDTLEQWLPRMRALRSARRVRWSVDVDPIELF